MKEKDYKQLYEEQLKLNAELVEKIERSNAINFRLRNTINAYRTHLELFEKELVCLKNNIENYTTVQKDEKVNALTDESFKNLATARIEDNPDFNYVLVVFDLDDFKNVNDTYGHDAGDKALRHFVDVLKKQTREEIDLIGRFGGDEFVLLLENITYENAVNRINSFLNSISSIPVRYRNHDGAGEFFISASAGLTEYKRDIDVSEITDEDSKFLSEEENYRRRVYRANFLAADRGLYDAKHRGKNQVCNFEEEDKKLTLE